MSPFFVKAIQLLLSLSILIVLHELGHYIPAKLFKTRVEKFYLFFDVKFSLFKKKIGETVYGIGWLPLGGYVKIAGMIDESMDTEQMKQPAQPWEFRSKPAWQRLIIMLGGVTVNLVLGFLIYMMIVFVWGKTIVTQSDLPNGFAVSEILEPYGFQDGDQILEVDGTPLENVMDINRFLFLRDIEHIRVRHRDGLTETLTVPSDIGNQMFEQGVMTPFTPMTTIFVETVVENSPAQKAGLLPGDQIYKANNIVLSSNVQLSELIQSLDENSVTLEVLRSGTSLRVVSELDDQKKMGIGLRLEGLTVQHVEYGFLESIGEGIKSGYWTLHDYVAQFGYLFTKKGATQMGGFGAIGNLFPATWNWQAFWANTAFISIILAFMNILPIPALDGGHVMFLLYEIATGRKPNDKFMEYAQMIGFFLLIALVLFANGNDIYRALFN
jgi:regulator of sigma E protease